ncbi:MAG: transglycosylase domain-containing protein, partial [Bacteroidota bacterium]
MKEQIANVREQQKETYAKMMKWLWRILGVGVLATILFFVGLSFTDLPTFQELENPKSDLATEIYGDNLEVIGRFYAAGGNRISVAYDELSPNLIKALVATEDERYYRHAGIDFRGLARAVFFLGKRGGASTITQQLAKQLFTDKYANSIPERLMQKFKEWIIAVRLEKRYTKEEIIAMYLNIFDFTNNAVGIKAASEIYFNTTQDSLSVEQAALFVGMLQNPTFHDPIDHPERSQNRRNVVLFQMHKNDLLTKEEFDYLKEQDIDMSKFKRATQSEGMAPYFRAELAKDVRKILQEVEKSGDGSYDLYKDGLKIYTTIHPEMQRIAEQEMLKHMKQLQAKFAKHWNGFYKDPWAYKTQETTDRQMEIRAETLTRMIRSSDRYRNIRPRYLNEVAQSLASTIKDLRLRDVDVDRILEAENDKTYINDLLRGNMISEKMASQYRKVLRHPNYDGLKEQWEALQAEVEKAFDEKVKMRVFAYNEQMEKDTMMSPLDSIKYHQMFLQVGSMAVDPLTGYVKTWVGGINHKYFKFDHVRSRRQVGSTFKPFVYATAIDRKGFSPCFPVNDRPYSIHPGESSFYLTKEWMPANSNKKFTYQDYTLRDALRRSKNSVTVFLMKEIGSVGPVIDIIDRMGIDTESKYPGGEYIVPRVPSIALGAADLTVQEMTGAYTTFANNGYYSEPTYILKIEDKNGKELYSAMPKFEEVLNPRY